jgi:hypothetical protein
MCLFRLPRHVGSPDARLEEGEDEAEPRFQRPDSFEHLRLSSRHLGRQRRYLQLFYFIFLVSDENREGVRDKGKGFGPAYRVEVVLHERVLIEHRGFQFG